MTEQTLPSASRQDAIGGAAQTGSPGAASMLRGALTSAASDTIMATAAQPDSLTFIGGVGTFAVPGDSAPGSVGAERGLLFSQYPDSASQITAPDAAALGMFRVAPALEPASPNVWSLFAELSPPASLSLPLGTPDGLSAAGMAGQGATGANDFIVFLQHIGRAEDLIIGVSPAETEDAGGAGGWFAGFGTISAGGVTMTLSDNTTITLADLSGGPDADGGG